MTRLFQVVQQVHPEAEKPFYVAEWVDWIPRICAGPWATIQEAKDALKILEQETTE